MEKFLFINFCFDIFSNHFSNVQYVTLFIEIITFLAYSCVQDIFHNFYSERNFKP